MRVDETGDDGTAAEVTALVGVGRLDLGTDPLDDTVVGDDERRVADDAEEGVAGVGVIVAAGRVVRRQLRDAREEQAHAGTPPATRSMAPTSMRPTSPIRWWPSLTTTSPPTTTVETSEATHA